ncbi:hypothetical protein HpBT0154_10170 [Helicobacter pylori]
MREKEGFDSLNEATDNFLALALRLNLWCWLYQTLNHAKLKDKFLGLGIL